MLSSRRIRQEENILIYIHGSDGKPPVENHTIFFCPAGQKPKEFDGSEWWDDSGDKPKPRTIPVLFNYGRAEVEDHVGKAMIALGQAEKTRLILPNHWNH